MIRMSAPKNCGAKVSIGGIEYPIVDGFVEVPNMLIAAELEAHKFVFFVEQLEAELEAEVAVSIAKAKSGKK